MSKSNTDLPKDFIRTIVAHDVENEKFGGEVRTRFPPEPNGYLHIGHAKSMCLNFGIAEEFPGGLCSLRFDDTNPTKENMEYVESIKRDVRWLGFDWGNRLFFTSDYFERLYDYAIFLIKQGKAYVDRLSADEIREYRGTLTQPGENRPHRNRPIEENLDLFKRMQSGEFPDGRIMILPIPSLIPLRMLPIPCVPWNLKIIALSTIGCWMHVRLNVILGKLNLLG